MCNLYSLTKGQQAIRELFRVTRDLTGNLASRPSIFPDQMAPVVRTNAEGERELAMLRWGFPPPPTNGHGHPVTNVRNTASSYWKPWLKMEQRCLVPLTSFCEYAETGGKKVPTWFAQDGGRPLMAFAGIWRRWKGERGNKAEVAEHGATEHELYAFLTCPPNDVVAPVHPKAMPVILTTSAEYDAWLEAPTPIAMEFQRPLQSELLRIVAEGRRKDGDA